PRDGQQGATSLLETHGAGGGATPRSGGAWLPLHGVRRFRREARTLPKPATPPAAAADAIRAREPGAGTGLVTEGRTVKGKGGPPFNGTGVFVPSLAARLERSKERLPEPGCSAVSWKAKKLP